MTILSIIAELEQAEAAYRGYKNQDLTRDADVLKAVTEWLKTITVVNIVSDRPSRCDTCPAHRYYADRDPYRHEMGE